MAKPTWDVVSSDDADGEAAVDDNVYDVVVCDSKTSEDARGADGVSVGCSETP